MPTGSAPSFENEGALKNYLTGSYKAVGGGETRLSATKGDLAHTIWASRTLSLLKISCTLAPPMCVEIPM